MSKALIVTSTASMVDQFLLPSAYILQGMGYDVSVACNFINGNTCDFERVESLKKTLRLHNIVFYQIDFERNVMDFKQNYKAYKQLDRIVSTEHYDLVHCHSPIGGVIGRLVAKKQRKHGTKVFYTAHGFHFYKGAPIKNWLLYYPVEKLCSYFTDVLITINHEDYSLATRKMKAKRVEYIPGVGVDLSRFENLQVDRVKKRHEIGVPKDDLLLLSVGELNENKNHQIIIRAIAKLKDPKIHYAIAGVGNKKDYLMDLSEQLGISNQVHLLGFRSDIPELNFAADIFCFPSMREGLSVSLMEAMASGLPCMVSCIRGNTDLISEDGGVLFDPLVEEDAADKLNELLMKNLNDLGVQNRLKVHVFSSINVNQQMKMIYEGVLE